jgi:hypothetical protein
MQLSCRRFIRTTQLLGAVFLILWALPGTALADACNPDFGDRLYEWVKKDSARQALALAERDFASRATNGRIVEYDDLRAEAIKLAAFLDGYAEQARKESEALGGKPPDLARAVVMQAQTSEALTRFMEAGRKLDGMRQRLALLAGEPSMQQFVAEGAHHVGRTTLLESITPLGRPDAFNLNARYSFYVQVTFDGAGNAKKGDLNMEGNEYLKAADATAMTVLLYVQEPISRAVAAAYLFIRAVLWGNEIQECNEKIDAQERRAAEATRLLATTLPSGTTTFEIYAKEQRRAQTRFAAVQIQFEQAYAALLERWRGLMAVNLARANLADSVLTAEKLETLRKAYNTMDPLARLFDSTSLTNLLIEVGALQSSIIDRELQVAKACRDAPGLRVAEDLLDSKRVGSSALAQLQRVAAFAPVLPTIEQVRRRIERPVPRAQSILEGASSAACGNSMLLFSAKPALEAVPIPMKLSARQEPLRPQSAGRARSALLSKSLTSTLAVTFKPQLFAVDGVSCVIYRDGETYRCSGSAGGEGANGAPLSNDLGNGGNPRYWDVSSGGHDGGFAADSAAASETVDAATANIERRIGELTERQGKIEHAVPAWLTGSEEGMKSAVSQQRLQLDAEKAFRTDFFKAQEDALRQTADRLNKFAKESGDSATLASLVKDSGVVDTSLADVPPEALVPDLPPLAGVPPARTRHSPGTSLMQQRVAREAAKGAALPEGEARTMHVRLLKAAGSLAGGKTPAADALAESLLQDALAQRFHESGVLSDTTISVLSDNGTVSHVPYSGGPLPPNSVLAHVEAFEYNSQVVSRQIAIAHQALNSDAVDREARLRALKSSEALLASAQSEFYGGSFVQGEGLLEVAGMMADLVTSWTPGVSWARDIYESVSGKDLITGRTLENWERGAAILGAITVGIGSAGSKVLHAFRVLEKAGLDLKRAEHIVDTARRINSFDAVPGVHAIEQMAKRGVSIEEVEEVLDKGTRFFDVAEGGIACVQVHVLAGAKRVLVVVDPDALVDAERMLIRTVHREEVRTDAELAKAFVQGTTDRLRFIPLPD